LAKQRISSSKPKILYKILVLTAVKKLKNGGLVFFILKVQAGAGFNLSSASIQKVDSGL